MASKGNGSMEGKVPTASFGLDLMETTQNVLSNPGEQEQSGPHYSVRESGTS